MRLVLNITSGSCTADLSSYPYTHTGYAKITEYTNAKQVKAQVQDSISVLGSTEKQLIGIYLHGARKMDIQCVVCFSKID